MGMTQIPSIESVMALDGRIFALLSPDEVKVLEFYRAEGRKHGISLTIINKADPVELAKATSQAHADEIMRSANSTVSVIKLTVQWNRFAARGFTEANLSALAADLLAWRKRAVLSNEAKLHELASMCVPFAQEGDEYQEAERLIVTFALESAACGGDRVAAVQDSAPASATAKE